MKTQRAETEGFSETDQQTIKSNDLDYRDIQGHMRGYEEFNGPVLKRKCTNPGFLFLFIFGNCALAGMSVYTFLNGDPSRLTKGYDIRGDICGIGQLDSKKFMYFPNDTTTDWSLCVEACPYYYYESYYCIYDKENPDKEFIEWGCWDAYQTTAYGFYCLPTKKSSRIKVLNFLSDSMQVLKRSSGDLLLSWDLMALGVLSSTVFGFSYLFLFKKARIIKWVVILSIPALAGLFIFLTYLLIYAANRSLDQLCGDYGPAQPEYCDHKAEKVYLAFSYIVIICGGYYVYHVVSKYKDFNIGIQMIELTCKPLHAIRELLLFPFIQIIVGVGFLLLLAMLLLWTMSSSRINKFLSHNVPGGVAYKIEYTALEKYILVYNVLMAFWWINFLVDLGSFVLAGAVSTWYFSRQKSNLYVTSI